MQLQKSYLLNMLGITKHADLHLRTRNVWQLHRTTETLVLLRVIVLQPNLQFNCLREIAFLLRSILFDLGDSFPQDITLQLTVESEN